MESYFTAVPDIMRVPLKVLDVEKYDEWLTNEDLDAPIPMITRIFVVYCKGPGTPVPIQIEIDRIETEYEEALPTTEEATTLSAFQYVDKHSRVDMLLRRNLLLAVVKGLDSDSANVLAQKIDGDGHELLRRAGWLRTRAETDALIAARNQDVTSQDVVENEEEGGLSTVDETGESTSLISVPSTQALPSPRKK